MLKEVVLRITEEELKSIMEDELLLNEVLISDKVEKIVKLFIKKEVIEVSSEFGETLLCPSCLSSVTEDVCGNCNQRLSYEKYMKNEHNKVEIDL